MRVRINRAIDTVTDSNNTCCNCHCHIFTFHKTNHTCYSCYEHCAVYASIYFNTVNFLVDENVRIFAVHYSHKEPFFHVFLIFNDQTFVEIANILNAVYGLLLIISFATLVLNLFLIYLRKKPVNELLHVNFSTV